MTAYGPPWRSVVGGPTPASSCSPSTWSGVTPGGCSRTAPEGVGYLLKDRVAQVDDFLDALDRVAAGCTALDPEVVRQLVAGSDRPDPFGRLTPRERDVLHEMAQGHTNLAIAQRLHVSQSAVEKHVNAIFDKLDLAHATGYSRRILAILRYLGS